MWGLFVISSVVFVVVHLSKAKATVRRCRSESCGFNDAGRCKRKAIDIYDNGVEGVCLWHTHSMLERMTAPFEKGVEIGQDSIIKSQFKREIEENKDRAAAESPDEFAKWLKKHGLGE